MDSEFKERLKNWRLSEGLTGEELGEALGVSKGYISLLESGKKPLNKKFLTRLVAYTKKHEDYWLYGASDKEYREDREEFKNIRQAIDQLLDMKIVKDKNDIKKIFEDKSDFYGLFVAAIKSDLEYYTEKKLSED